jgi:acetylornithine deacetylase/succinyl-diaminopimelate desuccinylase-like protein
MAAQSTPPTEVPVKKVPLSAEQCQWLEKALAAVSEERITQFLVDLVSIHSPTGEERAASEWLAQQMKAIGLDAFYQPVNELSGNAAGYYRGSGGGATVMFYAPIDTHIDVNAEADLPWVGKEFRPDMLPKGHVDQHGNVIGLCANNPKGFAACVYGAVDALARARVPLKGTVVAAFAGGGMPVIAPPHQPTRDAGLGSGVSYMINHGVTADFGCIVKGGDGVSWEEVGLCWFKLTVRGHMSYAGFPHTMPGWKNTVLDAAKVALALEAWFQEYNKRNSAGLISPWGAISGVRGGWPYKAAFPTAAVELYVDVRVSAHSTPAEAQRQFAEALDEVRAQHPDIEIDCEMFASYPGASTDPNHWIIQSSMRGWEYVNSRPLIKRAPSSGQTDASAIRNLGIPLARVGPPPPTEYTPPEWRLGLGGMGVAHVPDLARVSKLLVYTAIDSCLRDRNEVGL